MNWIERETCYVLNAPQLSESWRKARIGAICASKMAEVANRADLYRDQQDLAAEICTDNVTKEDNIIEMQEGILREPEVRKIISEEIQQPVSEIGLAVWKEDPIIRASLDGETVFEGKQAAVEIKVPREMYNSLIYHVEACRKGVNNKPIGDYIFAKHYDQITTGSVITGKEGCLYTVACFNSGHRYMGFVPTDEQHFRNILYPRAKVFHKQYVEPILKKKGITLEMPY